MEHAFVGTGVAFKLEFDPRGALLVVAGAEVIERSIALIVGTAPGERPMRPEFGCGVHDLILGGTDATSLGRIAHEVRRAIRRWEPRVTVEDVTLEPDPSDPSLVSVVITYVIKDTNDARNLVFPFYFIPAEGPSEFAPASLMVPTR